MSILRRVHFIVQLLSLGSDIKEMVSLLKTLVSGEPVPLYGVDVRIDQLRTPSISIGCIQRLNTFQFCFWLRRWICW